MLPRAMFPRIRLQEFAARSSRSLRRILPDHPPKTIGPKRPQTHFSTTVFGEQSKKSRLLLHSLHQDRSRPTRASCGAIGAE
eukprot:5220003-Amphidinium_carterae.1